MGNTTDTSGGAASEHAERSEDGQQVVDTMRETLDQWRTWIGELRVQADLAKLDVRDKATHQLDIAQNACLAAYSRLAGARTDTAEDVDSLRRRFQQLLHDVKEAFEAAQAVIARG